MKAKRLAFALVVILLLGAAVGSLLLLRRRARPGRSASCYGPFLSGNAFRRTPDLYRRELGEYPDSSPVFLDPFTQCVPGDGATEDPPPDVEPLDLEGRM